MDLVFVTKETPSMLQPCARAFRQYLICLWTIPNVVLPSPWNDQFLQELGGVLDNLGFLLLEIIGVVAGPPVSTLVMGIALGLDLGDVCKNGRIARRPAPQ